MKTLDLHGYTQDRAEEAIDRFLYKAMNDNEERVRIMTGKGSGTILKVTQNYLRKGNFHFQFEKMSNGKPNEGVLVVFL